MGTEVSITFITRIKMVGALNTGMTMCPSALFWEGSSAEPRVSAPAMSLTLLLPS